MEPGGAPPSERLQRSTRDDATLHGGLQSWAGQVLGPAALVGPFETPSGAGMSSETRLFEATWVGDEGTARRGRFVLRLPPPPDAWPIFPSYDFERQVTAMRLVASAGVVPVPAVRWYEPDATWLGAPFIVMERVDGDVPPDVMPYVFDSWLSRGGPTTSDGCRITRSGSSRRSMGRPYPTTPVLF
jgi:aminoglycoside phosphotransferase (APT) family kinase protein